MTNAKIAQQHGFSLPLQVLESAKGFYIGAALADGSPVSRESVEYFADHASASQALTDNTWTQREQA